MPNRWPISSGNWSNAAIWSGSLIPTAADDVFANNFTVNIDTSFQVLTLRNTSTTGVSQGGSFVFNSGSISGSIIDTVQPLYLAPITTPLVQVTAPSGTVTITLGGTVSIQGINASSATMISHTGACNLIISGSSFIATNFPLSFTRVISKTSTGNITVIGNMVAATNGAGSHQDEVLSNTAGNATVIGNLQGGTTSGASACVASSGTSLTIIGNIVGGATSVAVSTASPTFVTGNVTGSATNGISTSAPVIVTGSVVAQGAAAAISAGANVVFINVSGSVISSATANAISATAATSVVNLAGNMVNTAGKTAIYCQNLFLSDTATTQAQFFTVGSQDRTLYSTDTFPNLPSASNVRFGTTYGPGSVNVGTLRMASRQDVRSGVLTDNTTGSAILSIESLSNEIQTSTDPFAQRLKNISTVDTVGYLLTAFKK